VCARPGSVYPTAMQVFATRRRLRAARASSHAGTRGRGRCAAGPTRTTRRRAAAPSAAARAIHLSHRRSLSRPWPLHTEAPGGPVDLDRHPAGVARDSTKSSAMSGRCQGTAACPGRRRRALPSAALESTPAVLIRPAESLHHSIDRDVRDGRQFHRRSSLRVGLVAVRYDRTAPPNLSVIARSVLQLMLRTRPGGRNNPESLRREEEP
jgi:hypothetical protein